MKSSYSGIILAVVVLALTLGGCTVYRGVTDVRPSPRGIEVQKCDLKVYLALYGLAASQTNCESVEVAAAAR